ncbi:MAG: GNAT family N-acetyltransferase [Candidatus Omnitrophica bacterium]|nr:GNAT family N-acetyltransferase [Candidatus Omnitrophota bacterium]
MDLGNKIKIRQAELEDIPQILEVERAAWGKERAATTEMFKSRIKTFPEGTLVALIGNKIVGVVVTEIVNYDLDKNSFSWYEITDNGFIKKSHNSKGDTLYGVDLSVHPFYQNKGVGKKLMEAVGRLVIKYNLKREQLIEGISSYYKFCDKIKIEEYVDIEKAKKKVFLPNLFIVYLKNIWNKFPRHLHYI